ncbi:MAG TPA: hypothetical protein VFZ28_19060 [Burkholderiaceae bacterium]|nr:hypothetical protein [Burkholderiaceae bacterium]
MARKSTALPIHRGKAAAPRRAAARKVTPASSAEPNGGDHSGLAWTVPPSLSAVWTQFAQQMQQASEQTWQNLSRDLEAGAEDVQRADTPQQLAGAPLGFNAEQVTRWAQLSNQLAASLLDVQAAWFKEVEAATSQWLAPLVTSDGRIAFGSAQDLVDPPEPAAPMQAWWSAQQWWTESAKVWLNAMSHDLQGSAARAQ